MGTIFLGSEALARGEVSRARLRSAYRALFPDVYQPAVAEPTLYAHTVGAWLWSKRRGVVTGRAAAALHGAEWVDEDSPIELLWHNNRPPRGIITRNDRFTCDEVVEMNGMAVASIQRTAFDLGRFLPRGAAVAHLDALSRATGLAPQHVLPLAERYKGARGVRRCREALELMDPRAQSPKETWLRLLLMDAGFRRPQTQIPVLDDYGDPFAYLDLGWRDAMIAVEYDGQQHQNDRLRYVWDHKRLTKLRRCGWLHVRVIKEDSPYDILQRVREAWAQRETARRAVKRSA
jgi:very-short-patch-repair endonuclease